MIGEKEIKKRNSLVWCTKGLDTPKLENYGWYNRHV